MKKVLGGFPVKYATCTIDVKAGLFEMEWIGYHFEPHGNLVRQYRIMDRDYTYEEVEKRVDEWANQENQVSHRVTYEKGDLSENSPTPFTLKRYKRGWQRGEGLFAQWVHDTLDNMEGPYHQDRHGAEKMTELAVTGLTIKLQHELMNGEYYSYATTYEEEGYAGLIPFCNPDHAFYSQQWVETGLVGTTLDVIGQSETTLRPEGEPPKTVPFLLYNVKEGDDFHFLRTYKLIKGKLHYFSTRCDKGYIARSAAPPDSHLAMRMAPKLVEEGALEVVLLKSAKELLDQYEPKVLPELLRLPKKEGLHIRTADPASLTIGFEQDKILGRFWHPTPTGQRGSDTGFEIALSDITDSSGYITSKAIKAYYKKCAKELTSSYGALATSVGIDEHIWTHSAENGDMETAHNKQGRLLTAARACVKYGFLRVTSEDYNSLEAKEEEHKRDLFLYALKALLLLRTPSVKEQIKRDTKDHLKLLSPNKKAIAKASKVRYWGSDKITYLYPKKGTGKGKRYHFVNGHVRRLPSGRITDVSPHYRGDLGLGMVESSLVFGTPESKAGYSQVALDWLKSIESSLGRPIRHAERGGEYRIPLANGKYYKVDGYDAETNTIYEFHGDYYHGNPNVYSPDEVNSTVKRTMGELYEATKAREDFLRANYNLVVIWESEWNKTLTEVKQ